MFTTEKIRKLYTENTRGIVFYTLTVIAMAFFLVSGEVSRNAYYILTYVALFSTLFLIYRDKKIYFYWLPTMIFLLGLSKWVWAISTTNHLLPLIAEHYEISGKRLILGAFVLYCIHRLAGNWRMPPSLFKAGTLLLSLMICIITWIAISQFLQTGDRPKINSDAATSGAYMFTLLSLVTLWSIQQAFPRHHAVLYFIILLVSFTLLSVTQTRSAIILFSLFFLAAVIRHIIISPRKTRLIFIGIFSSLVVIALLTANKYSDRLIERVETVKTEIQQYTRGDTSTSIGGRFGMWQAGWWAFTQHPFGQSADSRNVEAKIWLDKNQPHNEIAYINIQYHTHNDLVESFSLQGIAGGLIMLGFFFALLLPPLFEQKPRYEVLLLAIPVICFSMGDSQFYNRESPYFILLIWGYFIMVKQGLLKPFQTITDQPS